MCCLPDDDEVRKVNGKEGTPGTDMVKSKLEELVGKTAIEEEDPLMKREEKGKLKQTK